jgi:RimJ/RimL family protein N-acetyltransferase
MSAGYKQQLPIENKGSQRVLEKAGFTLEGTIRKHVRGARRDAYLYRILREEWKEPKILTKAI